MTADDGGTSMTADDVVMTRRLVGLNDQHIPHCY